MVSLLGRILARVFTASAGSAYVSGAGVNSKGAKFINF
jgi:hypothetical protein